MYNDKKFRLQYVDIDSKTSTLVAQSKTWEIGDITWSPDSKWIAYSDRTLTSTMSQIFIYNVSTKSNTIATDNWYNSNQPFFSVDGNIYFLRLIVILILHIAKLNGITRTVTCHVFTLLLC